jgi:hypothetical protein
MREVKKQTNNTSEPEILEPEACPKIGRPVGFSQDLADEVLARIADGELLSDIGKDESMPTARQFRHWLTTRPELTEAHTRARRSWADTWAERVMDISFNPKGGAIDADGNVVLDHAFVGLLRLQTDNAKWLVGKYYPRLYGDRPEPGADDSSRITISWLQADPVPIAPEPAPPKQITYQRPSLPADLTDADWSVMLQVLEAIKRVIPSNSDSPPAEVFEVIRKALLEHFRDEPAEEDRSETPRQIGQNLACKK